MFTFNLFYPPPNVQTSALAVIGEMKMYAGPVAPAGWLICNGQMLLIAEHQALFNAVGNAYGGDGVTTFALPDMRDRAAVGASASKSLGSSGGAAEVTIAAENLPEHSHTMSVGQGTNGTISPSAGAYLTATAGGTQTAAGIYTSSPTSLVELAAGSAVGEDEPLDIQNPYVSVHYIIYAGA